MFSFGPFSTAPFLALSFSGSVGFAHGVATAIAHYDNRARMIGAGVAMVFGYGTTPIDLMLADETSQLVYATEVNVWGVSS